MNHLSLILPNVVLLLEVGEVRLDPEAIPFLKLVLYSVNHDLLKRPLCREGLRKLLIELLLHRLREEVHVGLVYHVDLDISRVCYDAQLSWLVALCASLKIGSCFGDHNSTAEDVP